MDDSFLLKIDMKAVEKILKDFPIDEKIIAQSHNAALTKAADYLKKISMRELSDELKLALNILRNRIGMYRNRGIHNMDKIKIFYGLNDIPMRYLNPQQTATGVKTAPTEIKGAFIARIQKNAGFTNVYKRKDKRRMPVIAQKYQINIKSDIVFKQMGIINSVNKWHDIYIREFERNLLWRSAR